MDQNVADCPDCQRLWRHYADTVAHLHELQRQQTAASMTFDLPTLRELQPLVFRAMKDRSDAADELVRHQQRQHVESKVKTARKPN